MSVKFVPPQTRGGSYMYPQSMFLSKIRKINKKKKKQLKKSISHGHVFVRIRVVSPVGRFARSFRPESFRPGFMGGSFRPY